MFTGIIEEIGTVRAVQRGARSFSLEIAARKVLGGTAVGDSIATNGVCLTVTRLFEGGFAADVMPETVRCTTLRNLRAGSRVNLERALRLSDRLGGHLVAGHVEAVGRLAARHSDDTALRLTVEAPEPVLRYVVAKGSVTLDGVSLTVTEIGEHTFGVSLIPHTQSVTTLHERLPGDEINLESDLLAHYVERLLGLDARRELPEESPQGLTFDTLRENGFF